MAARQTRLGDDDPITVCTVGHSTRSLDEFVSLLEAGTVAHLVDVRRWPTSKHNPQFNQPTLADGLEAAGIAYTHEERLGGYRDEPEEGSVNTGWRSDGFQAYADHLATDEGQAALDALADRAHGLDEADEGRVCVMCAEAVPERCHRRLVSDALVARGFRVVHLVDEDERREHALPDFARVRGKRVVYPG